MFTFPIVQKLSLSPCSRIVLSTQAIHAVERAADAFEAKSSKSRAENVKQIDAQPAQVIKPMMQMCAPRSVAFALGDRVCAEPIDNPITLMCVRLFVCGRIALFHLV